MIPKLAQGRWAAVVMTISLCAVGRAQPPSQEEVARVREILEQKLGVSVIERLGSDSVAVRLEAVADVGEYAAAGGLSRDSAMKLYYMACADFDRRVRDAATDGLFRFPNEDVVEFLFSGPKGVENWDWSAIGWAYRDFQGHRASLESLAMWKVAERFARLGPDEDVMRLIYPKIGWLAPLWGEEWALANQVWEGFGSGGLRDARVFLPQDIEQPALITVGDAIDLYRWCIRDYMDTDRCMRMFLEAHAKSLKDGLPLGELALALWIEIAPEKFRPQIAGVAVRIATEYPVFFSLRALYSFDGLLLLRRWRPLAAELAASPKFAALLESDDKGLRLWAAMMSAEAGKPKGVAILRKALREEGEEADSWNDLIRVQLARCGDAEQVAYFIESMEARLNGSDQGGISPDALSRIDRDAPEARTVIELAERLLPQLLAAEAVWDVLEVWPLMEVVGAVGRPSDAHLCARVLLAPGLRNYVRTFHAYTLEVEAGRGFMVGPEVRPVREAALKALGALDAAEYVPLVGAELFQPLPAYSRIEARAAVTALRTLDRGRESLARYYLRMAVEGHEDVVVAADAAWALGVLKDADSLDVLRKAAANPAPILSEAATKAIERIGKESP